MLTQTRTLGTPPPGSTFTRNGVTMQSTFVRGGPLLSSPAPTTVSAATSAQNIHTVDKSKIRRPRRRDSDYAFQVGIRSDAAFTPADGEIDRRAGAGLSQEPVSTLERGFIQDQVNQLRADHPVLRSTPNSTCYVSPSGQPVQLTRTNAVTPNQCSNSKPIVNENQFQCL